MYVFKAPRFAWVIRCLSVEEKGKLRYRRDETHDPIVLAWASTLTSISHSPARFALAGPTGDWAGRHGHACRGS